MPRPINQNRFLRASLGVFVAVALCGARTEKIWAETLGHLDLNRSHISLPVSHQEPFDPARVPQSGGMASRLLAGIKAKLA
jgi:hypothetical protein